jgi:predicted signal transduction protein with EAL and GGDEF domain
VPVTISIGVSAACGEHVDYETLFKAADEALYEAKRGGRNRVVAARDEAAGGPPEPASQNLHEWIRAKRVPA